MTKIIMNGCNGKMGQVITRLVSEDNECEIVAGFDVNAVSYTHLTLPTNSRV